jgi:DNA-binding MarR family transcriptional regulator
VPDSAAKPVGEMLLPPVPLRLGYLYSSTMRLLQQLLSRRLAPHDLTPPQFGAFMLILNAPRLSLRELARYTQGDSPTLCRILDRLEARGLVRRRQSAADRRYVSTGLTPRGRSLATRGRSLHDELEEKLLAGFDEREIAHLRALMTRVLRNAMSLLQREQDSP